LLTFGHGVSFGRHDDTESARAGVFLTELRRHDVEPSVQKGAGFCGWQRSPGLLLFACRKNKVAEATMNAATVSRILTLIPDRAARVQSGATFHLEAASCTHPERLAHVSKFLRWLSPLDALTREDQCILGLIASNGRPVHAADEEDADDAELESESWARAA
jgi:hypothetical protein